MSTYRTEISSSRPFDQVVADVRAALSDEGFGVLTEIDVRATMRAKLDVDIEPQVILGACNPMLAHRGLLAEPSLGVLLPCNVVVRQTGQATTVAVIDAMSMVDLTANPALQPVADEAAARLGRALSAVKSADA
ncbi:MAG: DUF302 domain-containing protein [Candidatus Nanopelagicales bacterium]